MLVEEKTSIYHAIKLTLREISDVLYAHALMTQKSCAVGMRNAKLGNHLNWKSTGSHLTLLKCTILVTKVVCNCCA